MNTIHVPGPCERLGCGKHGETKIRIDGEFFAADAKRGVEAGYRLYGLCCGCGNVGTVITLGNSRDLKKSKS
jgi:hypothetical protein